LKQESTSAQRERHNVPREPTQPTLRSSAATHQMRGKKKEEPNLLSLEQVWHETTWCIKRISRETVLVLSSSWIIIFLLIL